MKMWMFNCRQIARLVSESMDHTLPLNQRMGVRFHLMMCRHCGRYEQQLHRLRRLARSQAPVDGTPPSASLDEKAKNRLRRRIAAESQKNR